MNYLKTSMLCVMLSLCLLQSSAQNRVASVKEPNYNKPRLFNDLPERMGLRVSNLESVLDMPVGSIIKTQIADNFIFQGTVVSRSDDRDVKSVVVKSTNRQGATLTFTKTRQSDGTFSYIGRIISFNHGDAYDIVKENGQFVLQKKELDDIVSE